MRRRRTTTHEIDFALPLNSGEYLNVVLPGQTHRVPEQAVGYFSTNAQGMRYPHFRAASVCMWAVAWLRPPAKPSSVPVPSGPGCGFLPEGLDVLLPLCTAALNRTYDAFWQDRSSALFLCRNN